VDKKIIPEPTAEPVRFQARKPVKRRIAPSPRSGKIRASTDRLEKTLRVRTDLYAGESGELDLNKPIETLGQAVELYQTANQVVGNALVDPEALKLFMNYLPAANE
jgi:hypothetical protein